ncbi:MAG: anti-sigma factor domain-containing protein, partial [Pseudoclavibacter sp.]
MRPNEDGERDALEQQLAAEALHARDADGTDDRALHSALSDGSDAARDLASYHDVAAQLGLAVEPVAPSAAAKAQLFARLDEDPGVPSLIVSGGGPTEVRSRRRPSRRPLRAVLVAGAALVAAVALFFAGGVVLGGSGSDQAQPLVIDEGLAQILAADDVARAQADVEGGGLVTVYWSAELASSAIVAQDMPQIPASNDYELWYIGEAGAASAGLLELSADGAAAAVLEGAFVPGVAIGITVEPE